MAEEDRSSLELAPTPENELDVARAASPKGNPLAPTRMPPGPSTGSYILRQPYMGYSPIGIAAESWRNIVGRAPIVALCKRTLTLEITAVPWRVVSDDEEEIAYYSDVINSANGETFDLFIERLIDDVLTVPFGGAVEVTRYRDGTLAMFYHVDGATLFPTYNEKTPFVQIDPESPTRRAYFNRNSLARIMWAPLPDVRNYGWSRTPVMEVFSAVEALMRSDVFYQQFLSNTPEAGILDLMDMKQDAALEWVKSWQELMMGIDPMKVPVLYEHSEPAKFLPFSRPPAELSLPELVKRYAEQVCAAHGMDIADLGLFEHTNTLAGASRMVALSKRQGLGSLMRKIANLLNSMLPPSVTFEWDPLDMEDKLRKVRTQKARADTLMTFARVDPGSQESLFPASLIRKQAIADGILDIISLEELDKFEKDLEKKREEAATAAEVAPPLPQDAAEVPDEGAIPDGAPGSPEAEEQGQLAGEDLLTRHRSDRHNQKSHGNRYKNTPTAGLATPNTVGVEQKLPAATGAAFSEVAPPPPEQVKGLKGLEEASLENYKGSGYLDYNTSLRGGSPPSRDIKALDAVLDRGTLGTDGLLYRGASTEVLSTLKLGQTFSDKGFVSTSISKDAADTFSRGIPPMMMRIKAPATTKGAFVGGREAEFILPRGQSYKVTGVNKRTRPIMIDVEIVNG
jgi:hypothetical protein